MSFHSSGADLTAAPVTPAQLAHFLKEAPTVYKNKLHRGAKRQILTNCYRALWSNNLSWMQKYFFKEGLSESENLSTLLEKYNLFDSNDDASAVVATNPDNVLIDTSAGSPEYWESQRGKQCGHLFKKGESVYRCRNCGLDDTCVMCSRCFHGTQHEGHDVKIWISRGGGCCDCGDPEAWKIPLHCAIHSPHASGPSTAAEPTPALDLLTSVPAELLASVKETIAVVIDYMLETFATSPEDVSPTNLHDIQQDCEDSHKALHIPIANAAEGQRQMYACVLWNDEKHSFDEVISIVVRSIGCAKHEAIKIAENVDAYGRTTIKISDDVAELLEIAQRIHSIKLAVTIRSIQNTLREEICGILLDWLKDLIGGRYKFFSHVQGGNCIMRDTVCEVLCEDWSLRSDLAALSTRSRRGRMVEEDDSFASADDGPEDGFTDEELEDAPNIMNEVNQLQFNNDGNEFVITNEDVQDFFQELPWIIRQVETQRDHNEDEEEDDELNDHETFREVENEDDDDLNGPEVFREIVNEDEHDDDEEIYDHWESSYEQYAESPDAEMHDDDEDEDSMHEHGVDNDVEMNTVDRAFTVPSRSSLRTTTEHTAGSQSSQPSSQPKSVKPRSSKHSRDIIDLDWDLDAWLTHVEHLEAEEIAIASSLHVPVNTTKGSMKEANDLLKKEFKRKLRLDYLLQYDLRLWKSARASIKDLLIGTLISNFDYRRALGTRYARNYPELVDAFFFKDREPEHSVSTLSVQLLTVPTVASMLVKEYKYFGIVCSILANFFLTDDIHMLLSDEYRHMQVDCLSRSITRHRYAYTFLDLRYVLNADPVKLEVTQSPLYLRHFIDMLFQFQGMDPIEREKFIHVEYEANAWVSAFNVTLQISKLCRQFADCFALSQDTLSPAEVSRNLCRSVYRLLKAIADWSPRLANRDKDSTHTNRKRPLIRGVHQQRYHQVNFAQSGTFEVVEYDVSTEPVSFHHPFHWLLSEILEHVTLFRDELLSENGWHYGFKNMMQAVFREEPHDLVLTILDYPIRTMVMLSQINSGVWVRNGYGVRNQARTYRDVSVRENTYDRDIYLLQIGFVATNPSQLLATMLDRFDIVAWFNGRPDKQHEAYDANQKTYIVEEFLNLLIICATERGFASGMSVEHRIHRAIVQYLGISGMAYSELLKMIPDSLSEHESFESQLSALANYKEPDGLTDHGIYELKEEYHDEIEPYYWHYTRNQREEAFDARRKRWKQQHPDQKLDDKEEFFIVPEAHKIGFGPFKYLGNFLHTPLFCHILVHALWHPQLNQSTASDTIIDEALHLALLAIVDQNNVIAEQTRASAKGKSRADTAIDALRGFVQNATEHGVSIVVDLERQNVTLLDVLLKRLEDPEYRHIHKRCNYIVHYLEQHASDDIRYKFAQWRSARYTGNGPTEDDRKASDAQAEYERKKAAAKARQAAIMSQFAQAQNQFMSQYGEEYEDEDESDYEQEFEEETQATQIVAPDGELELERICHFPSGTCIVCQEELDRSKLYGMLGLVQKSHILRQTPLNNHDVLSDILDTCQGIDPTEENNNLETLQYKKTDLRGFPSDEHVAGLHVSSCGHLMHAECFENYQSSVANETPSALRALLPDSGRKRFLCPLCKALGNTLLPIVWKGKKESYPGVLRSREPFESISQHGQDLISQLCEQVKPNPTDEIPGSFGAAEQASQDLRHDDPHLAVSDLTELKRLYFRFMTIIKLRNGRIITGPEDMHLRCALEELFDMYAYTISAVEIAQRGVKESSAKDLTVEHTGTFLDGISTQTQMLLKVLSKTNRVLPRMVEPLYKVKERHALSRLQLNALMQVFPSPDSGSMEDDGSYMPLLADDPFRVFNILSFTLTDDTMDIHHILRLLYLAELVKVTMTLLQKLPEEELLKDAKLSDKLRSLQQRPLHGEQGPRGFAAWLMGSLDVPASVAQQFFDKIGGNAFAAMVRTFTLPFLRKCLLLMVVHHGFVLQNPQDAKHLIADNEYDRLVEIMGLPDFESVFNVSTQEQSLIDHWCRDFNLRVKHQDPLGEPVRLSLNLPTVYSLLSLPYRMDQLFDESLRRACRNCGTLPEYPALCLMCGTFVCSRRFCCSQNDMGECNTHMLLCGGEVGIYMVVKECFVLLLHDNGGTIMSAPYLDTHGEVDLFLK
ncbi:uncharacterized protein BYT42DRAFT_588028 [Radiomyces spectabilis]|uniref:uncharacterized protein n=1 Tax=Radiomyces spectabilis TaxID=64574 RepID=UPI00221FBD38|nr:uncharacterized protein BYT42DRAFT_588028 [Radiomyces spectabilis]KAI8366836.1 hypothetical protein BYT42DRAFT_588028 [Radiomyces spectabilis]